MRYGFEIYRADGTVKFSEDGGIATFVNVGAPNQSVQLGWIPSGWVWYVPVAFINREPVITDYNLPSYFCYATATEIKFDFPSIYNPQIFWGIA